MNTTIKTAVMATCLVVALSCQKESDLQATTPNDASNIVAGKYPSVLIGKQTWMLKNLDVTHYRNGDKIPHVEGQVRWGALTTGAWCWYNNDSAKYAVYGKLYNWYAVNDPRGLAPSGWHIPTDSEWTKLSNYLGNNAGGKLKDTGTIQAGTGSWYAPNAKATNKSGFTGLGGGYREPGQFRYIGEYAVWWSSSLNSVGDPWVRSVVNTYGGFYRDYYFKEFGFAVRCIKN